MIVVIATLALKPGMLESFAEAAIPAIAAARQEPGCQLFDLHASVTDPERMVFIERWDDRAAFDAHSNTPHLAAFRTASAPLVQSIKIEIMQPDSVEVM